MALEKVRMSHYDTIYIKDLEERVTELEEAIEKALKAGTLDGLEEVLKILKEVN